MDTPTLIKVYKSLKIVIIVSLLALFFILLTNKLDHCDVCKFKIGEKKLSLNEFYEIYKDKCYSKPYSVDNKLSFLLNESSIK